MPQARLLSGETRSRMSSLDVSLQLLKLWDDRSSEGQLLLLRCAAGEEVSVGLGTSLAPPKWDQAPWHGPSLVVKPWALVFFLLNYPLSPFPQTTVVGGHSFIVNTLASFSRCGKNCKRNTKSQKQKPWHERVRMGKTVGFLKFFYISFQGLFPHRRTAISHQM